MDDTQKTTAQLVEDALDATNPNKRLEDTVTYGYKQLYPQFEKHLKDMSAEQLRAAWKAAMLYPLGNHPPLLKFAPVKTAFAMATKLDEYKFSMLLLGIDKYGDDLKLTKGSEDAPVQSVPSSEGIDASQDSIPSNE